MEGGTQGARRGSDVAPAGNGEPQPGAYSDADIKDAPIYILGFSLRRAVPNRVAQLSLLAASIVASAVACAAIQERVLYVPGFRFTGWISTLTSVTYVACASLEIAAGGGGVRRGVRRGSLGDYARLSVMTMGGMYLTNLSLRFLSYPLRVVFKSSKLIPTMAISVLYQGKKYSKAHYFSVALLTMGVILFTLGDARGKAVFDIRGIAIIAAGAMLESLASNYEERWLFGHKGCQPTEVLLYSSLFGIAWSGIADMLQGEMLPAIRHSLSRPEAAALICLSGVAGYVSMSGTLLLIKVAGATPAEVVKTLRKVVTICISFVLYGKPWTVPHVIGGLLFTASIAVERRAAGGAGSRRLATWLMTGSMLLAAMLFLFSPGHISYAVVVDAGSTGTRLHVFKLDAWTLQPLRVGERAQIFEEQPVAIAGFADDPARCSVVLDPLMAAAVAVVPPAQRASTPLALRANAVLAETLGGEKVANLLAGCRAAAEPYGFKDAGTELMNGAQEAEWSWLTVNFLMRSFGPGVHAIREPRAVLDLRSTSLQAAHLVGDRVAQAAGAHGRESFVKRIILPFGGGSTHLYRHSYLGYGLVGARSLALSAIGGGSFPCAAAGAEVLLQRLGGQVMSAVGGGGPPGLRTCRAVVDAVLRPGPPCGSQEQPEERFGNCTFAGGWSAPPPQGSSPRVVLLSHFFDRMQSAGAIPSSVSDANLTVGAFDEASSAACSSGDRGPLAASGQSATWLCFDLTFMAAVLRGLGAAPDELLLAVKVLPYRGSFFQASWALGLAISHEAAA